MNRHRVGTGFEEDEKLQIIQGKQLGKRGSMAQVLMKTHPRQRPQRLKALLEAFGISVFFLLFFFSGGRKWQLSQHRIDETWSNVLFLSKTPTLIVWPLHAKLFSLVHEN